MNLTNGTKEGEREREGGRQRDRESGPGYGAGRGRQVFRGSAMAEELARAVVNRRGI